TSKSSPRNETTLTGSPLAARRLQSDSDALGIRLGGLLDVTVRFFPRLRRWPQILVSQGYSRCRIIQLPAFRHFETELGVRGCPMPELFSRLGHLRLRISWFR